MQPFRFVHASRVQLDSPVIIPGECTPANRQLAEDATILAFRSLIEACISHDADLLLLTGDTFGASLVTLREQMELEQGLARLTDHDVTVIILPGVEDPPCAWREQIQLPAGVIVAQLDQREPIRVRHNGVEVACVFPVAAVDDDGRPCGSRQGDLSASAFQIGLVGSGSADFKSLHEMADEASVGTIHIQRSDTSTISAEATIASVIQRGAIDYLAVGLAGARQTHIAGNSTLHNPGPLQSLDADIPGPCGASLVSVEQSGQVRIESLPLACIRWERLSVGTSEAGSIEDLAVEMEQKLRGLSAADGEQLTIIQWDIDCSARLSDELRRGSLSSLWELIDAGANALPARHHVLRSVSQPMSHDRADEHAGPEEDLSLEANLRIDLERLIERVSHTEWGSTSWGRSVARELSRLSPSVLLPRVRETVSTAMRQSGNS